MHKVLDFIKKNKQFSFFLLLVILLALITIFAPVIAPQDPYASDLKNALQPPSSAHWFGTDKLPQDRDISESDFYSHRISLPAGTDQLGRDIFSRVIYASRSSLPATLILVVLIFAIGTLLGTLAGYFGGWIDAVIMRISDMMISFPGMVLAIAVAGIMGASVKNAVIAVAVVSWPKYARLARSLVMKIRHEDYIYAAIVTGSKTSYILRKYMLPNIIPTLIITAATDIGGMMLELAGLSFLGFGAKAPAAEWGLMLNEGRTYMQNAPWMMIYPGLAIVIVVVVFNLLGDSLRDVLDVREE